MRVATVDGLVTLFYDGSKPLIKREPSREWIRKWKEHDHDEDNWESWDLSDECKRYFRERFSWQQIIVTDGVTEIPAGTFSMCFNIKRMIFANTVIRIEMGAFLKCQSLVYVKWSINLEFIGAYAFSYCNLPSVFIPLTCREIRTCAFGNNKNLKILNIPQHVELGKSIISGTALGKSSPFQVNADGEEVNDDMNTWIKNMNQDEAFSLHRACSSFQPLKQVVYSIVQEKGLKAFKETNSAGITPSQYLKENPYTELTEMEIIHDYLMRLMGEGE